MDVLVFVGVVFFMTTMVIGILISISQKPDAPHHKSAEPYFDGDRDPEPYKKFDSYNHYDDGEYR